MSDTSGTSTGSLCLLCGNIHPIRSVCPCPQCLTYHDGSSCLGDVRCVICGIYHLSVACHGSIARICKVCGVLHSSFQGCPCARCGYWHKGSLCIDACALCNNFHEGNCPGKWSCYCKLCGHRHNEFVSCPCPRCYMLHTGEDCPAVEPWRVDLACESLDLFIGLSCIICGQCHGGVRCPCPQCHQQHEGNGCVGASVAEQGIPCTRCNVWHGADVCARDERWDSDRRSVPLPSASLHRRAVVVDTNEVQPIVMAPAHGDAVTDRHELGCMNRACPHCGARFWHDETIQCCYSGQLFIPEQQIPETLSNIIMSRAVQSHLRSYNTAMAMASVGHDRSGFPDVVFVLSGRSYHQVGTLLPPVNQSHSFAQIYILDTTEASDRRCNIMGQRLDRQVMATLHTELLHHNRYAAQFRQAAASDVQELVWTTRDNIMGMQIGALVVANGDRRSIVLRRIPDTSDPRPTTFIDDGHPLYHTLAYPLLFPTGAPGWFAGMVCVAINNPQRSVTLHDYGRYILMHRERCVLLFVQLVCSI